MIIEAIKYGVIGLLIGSLLTVFIVSSPINGNAVGLTGGAGDNADNLSECAEHMYGTINLTPGNMSKPSMRGPQIN